MFINAMLQVFIVWDPFSQIKTFLLFFFFYQGFLSRTLTTHRTVREGGGPSFISLYHFHPLTNIQTFICNFPREMTITYFYSQRLYLPDCYSMRFTTFSNYYLIDWWYNFDFCLFACWIDFRFCYSYMTWEIGGLELASTIILELQGNRLTKYASHPYISQSLLNDAL